MLIKLLQYFRAISKAAVFRSHCSGTHITPYELCCLANTFCKQSIADSFSNTLHPNNTAGWKELEKVSFKSTSITYHNIKIFLTVQVDPGQNQMLLNSTETFGLLLAENLKEGSTKVVKSDNISEYLH